MVSLSQQPATTNQESVHQVGVVVLHMMIERGDLMLYIESFT